MTPQLITPDLAREITGLTPRTLARYATAGHLWCAKTPGGHRRYDLAEIKALVNRPRDPK